jgi:tetratricopeptide (TPR) repeat protein
MAMTNQNSPPLPSRYATRFREYIVQSVAHILVSVRATDALLPDDIRVQALHTLSYALSLPEAWLATRELLLCMAPKMEQAGFRDEWIPYLEQGLHQSQSLGDTRIEAELHLQLGLLYQVRSKYDKALLSLTASAKEFAALNDTSNQAQALNRLAYIYCLQRSYEEASTLVKQSLELLDLEDAGRQFSYFVQGVIAFDEGRYECAIYYFSLSLALCEKQGDQRRIAQRLGSLGLALYEQNNYLQSITCLERAIILFDKIGDPVQQAVIRMNLGNVYLLMEESENALELYAISEAVLRPVQDELHITMLYVNRGIALRQLCQWQEAELSLLTAIDRWQQRGNVKSQVNSMDELGMVYLKQGLYRKALEVFEDTVQLLTQIVGKPGYTMLHQTVVEHLRQVHELLD